MGAQSHSNGSEPGPSNSNGHASMGLSPDALSLIRPVKSEERLMYPDDADWLEHQRLHDSREGKRKITGKRMPVDREEVVRLMLQGLRDMGLHQTADALQAESGYTLSSQTAIDFQASILGGRWSEALSLLPELGIPLPSAEASSASSISSGKTRAQPQNSSNEAKFLISRQKYLELLETNQQNRALTVLRKELTPMIKDKDVLRDLSGYMMCLDNDDLFERAGWDGAAGTSRRRLLEALQAHISPSVMVPSRRLATLFDQARSYQQQSCVYHEDRQSTSLYIDHECASGQFPTLTTHILADHKDEVWRIEWSPDGMKLATAGKDRTVVIWQLKTPSENGSSHYGVIALHHLRDHRDAIDALAWSPDGKTLVTGAGRNLYLWDAETGMQKTMPSSSLHNDQISTINWLPDGSGFVVASLDYKVVFYNSEGGVTRNWGTGYLQITDFVITPNGQRLIALTNLAKRVNGENKLQPAMSSRLSDHDGLHQDDHGFRYLTMEHNIVVVRISDQEILEMSPDLRCDVTSIKLSHDGRRVLINCAPDELQLWDIEHLRLIRRYVGHVQSQFMIRSCFGAVKDRFVLSGSEDGQVYIWEAGSQDPIHVLEGHHSTVNSVAWNPVASRRLFASCSDDTDVRIWQPPVSFDDKEDGMEEAEDEDKDNGTM